MTRQIEQAPEVRSHVEVVASRMDADIARRLETFEAAAAALTQSVVQREELQDAPSSDIAAQGRRVVDSLTRPVQVQR
jgi:hypothetical protein